MVGVGIVPMKKVLLGCGVKCAGDLVTKRVLVACVVFGVILLVILVATALLSFRETTIGGQFESKLPPR